MTEQYKRDFNISEKQLSDIALAAAKEAAHQTVSEILGSFGVNISNAESIEAFRNDIAFVRSLRSGSVKAISRVAMTILTMATMAMAVAVWEAFKSLVHH